MRLNMQWIAATGIVAATMIGFYSCGDILQVDNLAEDSNISSIEGNTPNKETIVMLYDYNVENKSLEYQAKKIDNTTGNPVRDAIKSFIQENNFKHSSNNFNVTDIRTTKEKTIFHFSGDLTFQSQSDSLLYWNALRMTIARNSNLTNFSFKLD